MKVEEKDVVLGLRSPKNRSLLSVNEDFEGERNDKIHFLFSLSLFSLSVLASCTMVGISSLFLNNHTYSFIFHKFYVYLHDLSSARYVHAYMREAQTRD